MTENQVITAIKKIFVKKDKNGENFLVIETDNHHTILVFDKVIPTKRWEELKVGQTYQFTIKKGNKTAYSLINFSKIWSFEIPATT